MFTYPLSLLLLYIIEQIKKKLKKKINLHKKNPCINTVVTVGMLRGSENILVESSFTKNQYWHSYIRDILTLNTTEGKIR